MGVSRVHKSPSRHAPTTMNHHPPTHTHNNHPPHHATRLSSTQHTVVSRVCSDIVPLHKRVSTRVCSSRRVDLRIVSELCSPSCHHGKTHGKPSARSTVFDRDTERLRRGKSANQKLWAGQWMVQTKAASAQARDVDTRHSTSVQYDARQHAYSYHSVQYNARQKRAVAARTVTSFCKLLVAAYCGLKFDVY